MSAANALTLFRAVAGVPIFVLIGYGERTAALLLFSIAALSDALDGFLARRGGTADRRGVLIDPLADKALVILTVIGLAIAGSVAPGLAAIVVAREVTVAAVRLVRHREGGDTQTSVVAKVKTACEMAALVLLIGRPTAVAADIGALLLTVAALVGIVTLPSYVRPHPAPLHVTSR